jgi:hypothetical protein
VLFDLVCHFFSIFGYCIVSPSIYLLIMWCNFKFEVVLFRSDSRRHDRVDCLCRPTGSTSFGAEVSGLIANNHYSPKIITQKKKRYMTLVM